MNLVATHWWSIDSLPPCLPMLGIAVGAAFAAGRAQYTSDESQLIAEQLRARGAKTVIVCSSAVHLPRAAERYRGFGPP